jgi:hypothetical protein
VSTQRVRVWCFAMLVCAAVPAAAGAQEFTSTTESVLARIDPGKVIRAKLDSERTVIGAYTPVGDGRLGIRIVAGGTEILPLSRLRELSVRGRHTKTGAIVGGIAGVAVGIFVGIMANGLCEGGDDCEGAAPFLIAIPAFGAGGALLGAAVGSAFPKWKRVFP